MPAYNAEKYIAESIRSVLDQTYRNWELVIVDDGSTDKTAEIVQSFLPVDSRIKYVFQQNRKLAAARNTGIEHSAGDLVAFLDSDDLWMKEKLERQEQVMKEVNADLIFSSGFIFNGDDTTNETVSYPSLTGKFDGADMFKRLLTGAANRIPVLSVLLRRNALQQAGLFDESPALHYGCEDYDLWLRLAKCGALFYGMEEKLVRYRVHANAMSRKKADLYQAGATVVEKHQHDHRLSQAEWKKVFGRLYRALTAALMEENRDAEAKESMEKLLTWDKFGCKTVIFRVLLKIAPGKFDALNRQRLNVRGRLIGN